MSLWQIVKNKIEDRYGWFYFLCGVDDVKMRGFRPISGDVVRVFVTGDQGVVEGSISDVRDFQYHKESLGLVLGGIGEANKDYVAGSPERGRCIAFRCCGLEPIAFNWQAIPDTEWSVDGDTPPVIDKAMLSRRSRSRRAAKSGGVISQKACLPFVMKVLTDSPNHEIDNVEGVKKIIEMMKLSIKFSPMDWEIVGQNKKGQGGQPRIIKNVCFQVSDLKKKGVVDRNAPRGIWRLTY